MTRTAVSFPEPELQHAGLRMFALGPDATTTTVRINAPFMNWTYTLVPLGEHGAVSITWKAPT